MPSLSLAYGAATNTAQAKCALGGCGGVNMRRPSNDNNVRHEKGLQHSESHRIERSLKTI